MPKRYKRDYQQIELGIVHDGKILHTYYINDDGQTIKQITRHVHWIHYDTSKLFFQEYNSYDGGPVYNTRFKSDEDYHKIISMLEDLAEKYPEKVLNDV